MMNFGDWQNMPDYREGWQDKNASGIARITKALDPATMIPGWGDAVAKPMHDVAIQGADFGNRVLSPVVGAAQDITTTITPGLKQAEKFTGMNKVQNFIRNKPVDAAAIAAATFFSGGAASGLGSAGTAAAPAASSGAGAAGGLGSFGAAGSQAITPAFASGAAGTGAGTGAGVAGSTTGSLAGASSITPSFMSGSYPGIAGASGSGMLGNVGTQAATNMLSGQAPSFLQAAQPYVSAVKSANQYRSNLNRFAPEDNEQQRLNAQSARLAEQLMNNRQY